MSSADRSPTRPPALRIVGLSKTFPGQRALDDVDLEIAAGEIHALVGQNGSGKSTIVKILAGYHEPDPGAVAEVAGVPFELGSAPAALGAGLRFVHQDLGLVESMTVSDNFRMNRRLRPLGLLRRAEDRAAARQALDALGYDIDPSALIGQLAESERTAVGVARALDGAGDAGRFPLLVLDEATASLPGPEVERLFGALRRIAAGGTAILFISHYLDEVLKIADRVTVLRDGRRVTTAAGAELTHEGLANLMLGRELVAEAAAHTRVEPPNGRRRARAVDPGDGRCRTGAVQPRRPRRRGRRRRRPDRIRTRRAGQPAGRAHRSRRRRPRRRARDPAGQPAARPSTPGSATCRPTGPTTPCSGWRRCART